MATDCPIWPRYLDRALRCSKPSHSQVGEQARRKGESATRRLNGCSENATILAPTSRHSVSRIPEISRVNGCTLLGSTPLRKRVCTGWRLKLSAPCCCPGESKACVGTGIRRIQKQRVNAAPAPRHEPRGGGGLELERRMLSPLIEAESPPLPGSSYIPAVPTRLTQDGLNSTRRNFASPPPLLSSVQRLPPPSSGGGAVCRRGGGRRAVNKKRVA